jgi:hypothetical protein
VDNYKKSLKTAEKMVDNYVDDVDRPVNMHQNAGNIYARSIRPKWRDGAKILHPKGEGIAKPRQKTGRPLETDGRTRVTTRL